ncbi:diphenol oxidase [Trichosporon asahii var. asahii CBS 2479]|uniref:Diphenol oxidase n=1 Tax=Trichosporon asahii var. asahii (strain ATCC 90039 / CBS 2479 / JCM 2466 / KCTC 7840 / NBRC 103889/ NCYC 2677 / UAMH 7654) TaxID=1186058 RepID=J8TZR3_TRIAS|nr:diphenol oxidase [Trichosporon asahii var. asahii CBS 2479]EJT53235.1 diphenol oxidase [Trichosporon asahii var. asahii CBS 2479]
MILPLIHFVALASVVTAAPNRLDKRQDNNSQAQSASSSLAVGSVANGPASSAAVSADSTGAAPSSSSAAASPPGASSGSATAIGGSGNPLPSASLQSSAVQGAPAPSASSQAASADGDVAPPSSSVVASGAAPSPTSAPAVGGTNNGTGLSGLAAVGGQLQPGAVFTTTRLIDADPFPLTQTLVQTFTVPTDAAGAQATVAASGGLGDLSGLLGLGGANNAGFNKAVISASGSAVEIITAIPQPPLPSKSNSADQSVFTPAADWDITAPPQTREYTWDIEYTAGAPDGFHRRMSTVNGIYPGPLIEANKGDTIVVHVNNKLDRSQSIHWHGLRQLKTPFMDGVPGTTQCPIRAGESFTYRFNVDDETGTYWWHSHSGNTQADGLHGGLIVHSPDQPYQRGRDYDEERIVYITDWMRDQADDIVLGIITEQGFRGRPVVPPPDAALVNGVGQSVCADADPTVQCDQTQPATLQVSQNRTRLRLISTASHAMYRISIDQHNLTVIEVDDTPIEPFTATEIPMHPGQRYSVIIDGSSNAPGDQIFLRSRLATNCLGSDAQQQEQKLVLQFPGSNLNEPVDQPWPNLAGADTPCRDLGVAEGAKLLPRNITQVPQTSFKTASFWTEAGTFTNWLGFEVVGFNVSGVQYLNYANKPALGEVALNRELNTSAAGIVEFNGDLDGAVDLFINSRDAAPLAHPFHIHSRPFFILDRGEGIMEVDQLDTSRFDLVNPLRRDVITLTGQEWVVLRLPADTPGVWPMHCHIGWHLAAGKQGLINMQPNALRARIAAGEYGPSAVGEAFTAEWNGLCAGVDREVIEAGRR